MDEFAMQVPVWLTVLLSLASGLVTFSVSTWFYIYYEERKQKLEVFRALMGSRHGLVESADPEVKRKFFMFLNEAFVVFGKSPCIIECLKNFKNFPGRAADNFT